MRNALLVSLLFFSTVCFSQRGAHLLVGYTPNVSAHISDRYGFEWTGATSSLTSVWAQTRLAHNFDMALRFSYRYPQPYNEVALSIPIFIKNATFDGPSNGLYFAPTVGILTFQYREDYHTSYGMELGYQKATGRAVVKFGAAYMRNTTNFYALRTENRLMLMLGVGYGIF